MSDDDYKNVRLSNGYVAVPRERLLALQEELHWIRMAMRGAWTTTAINKLISVETELNRLGNLQTDIVTRDQLERRVSLLEGWRNRQIERDNQFALDREAGYSDVRLPKPKVGRNRR